MGMFLKIIGAGWAVLGLANILSMAWTTMGEGLMTAGLIINVLLFIVPGFILYGIGVSILSKHPTPSTHMKCTDCAEFILKEARVCKHCGCKVVPQNSVSTSSGRNQDASFSDKLVSHILGKKVETEDQHQRVQRIKETLTKELGREPSETEIEHSKWNEEYK